MLYVRTTCSFEDATQSRWGCLDSWSRGSLMQLQNFVQQYTGCSHQRFRVLLEHDNYRKQQANEPTKGHQTRDFIHSIQALAQWVQRHEGEKSKLHLSVNSLRFNQIDNPTGERKSTGDMQWTTCDDGSIAIRMVPSLPILPSTSRAFSCAKYNAFLIVSPNFHYSLHYRLLGISSTVELWVNVNLRCSTDFFRWRLTAADWAYSQTQVIADHHFFWLCSPKKQPMFWETNKAMDQTRRSFADYIRPIRHLNLRHTRHLAQGLIWNPLWI